MTIWLLRPLSRPWRATLSRMRERGTLAWRDYFTSKLFFSFFGTAVFLSCTYCGRPLR